MQTSRISDALFTKTQQRVLGLLFNKPDQTYYLNEIIRLTHAGKGAIVRELERLTNAGILITTRIGNQHHYQANPSCPIYAELIAISRKTFGVTGIIQTALHPLETQITCAFIYGSVAKGQDTAHSDIDLLIISEDLPYADAMQALHDAEIVVGRPINPNIYTYQQVVERLKEKQSFMTRVMDQPKLWLKGSDSDIEKIRQLGEDQATQS